MKQTHLFTNRSKITSKGWMFIALISLLWTSCQLDLGFDSELLIGHWQSGTENYRYFENHTGITWNIADDVLESEAQAFTWTLVINTLTHIHIMDISDAKITKIYTVTDLSESTLQYEDEDGRVYTFNRVND